MAIPKTLGFVICCLLLSWRPALGGEIHEAASCGDLQSVRELISHDKSAVDTRDENGRTALHHSTSTGQLEVTKALLKSGADIEARDNRGSTPIMMAIRANDLPMVQLLADAGAELAVEHPAYGRAIDVAFWNECMKGRSGMTEFLISRGEPFDANNEKGIATPLNLATTFGNYEMAKFAVDRGADVNKISTQDGMTEFHFAVFCGHADIVRLFLDHGANPDVTTNAGIPPIFHAIDRGHKDVATQLLTHKAPMDFIEPQNGRSLLHVATIRGHADIVSLLLSLGADVNARDNKEHIPLYYAERYGHTTVANLVKEHGAESAQSAVGSFALSPNLSEAQSPGQATGWALQGRGWAVKTANHLLIIDCLQSTLSSPTDPSLANGFITASEIAKQDIIVVYSTFHWPDQLEYTHEIEDSLPRVTYIHNKNEPWRGCNNTVYVEPNETRNVGDATIHVIQAAHANPALGYVVVIDGVTLYCGIFASDNEEQFRRDLDSLQSHVGSIDIALIPLPESEEEESQFLRPLSEKLNPKMVCLSDPKGRTHLYPGVEKSIKKWGLTAVVFGPENPGDHFIYRDRVE